MEITIISGFLGAGKTTFLNRYLPALDGQTVVIENEFGKVGLDGALIQENVPVCELSSGCICCTLATDFRQTVREAAERYRPNHILIEPSGIGHLSGIAAACEQAKLDGADFTALRKIVIVDIAAFEDYIDAFGSFYADQIEYADLLLFSGLSQVSEADRDRIAEQLIQRNPHAAIYLDDWRELDPASLRTLAEQARSINERRLTAAVPSSEKASAAAFSSVTIEEPSPVSPGALENILSRLNTGKYGRILRAKGIIPAVDGGFLHFDLTLSGRQWESMETSVCSGGRVIVIGQKLNKAALLSLFRRRR